MEAKLFLKVNLDVAFLWYCDEFIFFSNLLLLDKVVCLSIKSEYCNRKKDLLETLTQTEEKEK